MYDPGPEPTLPDEPPKTKPQPETKGRLAVALACIALAASVAVAAEPRNTVREREHVREVVTSSPAPDLIECEADACLLEEIVADVIPPEPVYSFSCQSSLEECVAKRDSYCAGIRPGAGQPITLAKITHYEVNRACKFTCSDGRERECIVVPVKPQPKPGDVALTLSVSPLRKPVLLMPCLATPRTHPCPFGETCLYAIHDGPDGFPNATADEGCVYQWEEENIRIPQNLLVP